MVDAERESGGLTPLGVTAFYIVFAAVAILWDALRTGPSQLQILNGETWLPDTLLGLGVGLGVVVLSRISRRVFAPVRRLEAELAAALGTLSVPEILLYAAVSSVGEELFFRGAMQPTFGLVLTALIFGFAHGGYIGRLWIWSLFALVIGFVFGWMFDYTTNLWSPILAHFVVNGINLRFLVGEGKGVKE